MRFGHHENVTVVATQGFLNLSKIHQQEFFQAVNKILRIDKTIDFIVGDPETKTTSIEDEGRTARVPFTGPVKVYYKREPHEKIILVTFLLASEY